MTAQPAAKTIAGPASPAQFRCDRLMSEAVAAMEGGRPADAERLLGEARKAATACGPGDPRNAVVLHHLGAIAASQERFRDAVRLLEESVKAWESSSVGPDDPHVCGTLNALAHLHAILREPERAAAHFRRCLAIFEKARGPAHPIVGVSAHNLGTQLAALGRHAEAAPLFERALNIDADARGPDHPEMLSTLEYYAESMAALGHETVALSLSNRAAVIREAMAAATKDPPRGGCGSGCGCG
jgi:tetratricopeptide (TPR) repeat protein